MTPRCDQIAPHAHICRCNLTPDEHAPGWHECGDCGTEWHDTDHLTEETP